MIFLLKAIQFSVMVLKVSLKILLIVLFYAIDNFTLADEPFAKALRSFETWVLVNNNLCGKLFSSLESSTTLDENFIVISVLFFVPDFNLLSCNLENFTFKVLYWVVLHWYYIERKYNYNTLTVSCEKSKMVSFTSSIMKNTVVFPYRTIFAVKLIRCVSECLLFT